jgi:hypothetical protein
VPYQPQVVSEVFVREGPVIRFQHIRYRHTLREQQCAVQPFAWHRKACLRTPLHLLFSARLSSHPSDVQLQEDLLEHRHVIPSVDIPNRALVLLISPMMSLFKRRASKREDIWSMLRKKEPN